jgi:hypothetical protein
VTEFAVRIRAYAAAHFEWGDVLTLTWPDALAKYQSEYTGGDDGRAYPVTIHGEIRGEAASIEDAERRLGGAVRDPLSIVALASNAAVADPLAVACHGLDLSAPQPFVGYRTPSAQTWFPPGARRIDVEATKAMAAAIGTQRRIDLLYRAVESYRRALTHWVPEERLLAGEFLFIAAETLSRFLIESRATSAGMTPKDLARAAGLDNEGLRARYLRDEVFSGDARALEAMRDASNGFEHGYMSVTDVRGLLKGVLERSMGHVRRALIVATGMDRSLAARLLSDRYDEPRGLVPEIRFVTGTVRAVDPANPPVFDGGAIELEWAQDPPIVTVKADGRVDITFSTNVAVRAITPGAELDLESWGMRAAHVTPVDEVGVDAQCGVDDPESESGTNRA